MRTTLKIDDDILEVAKSLAHFEKRSVGEVISSLARKSLDQEHPFVTKNGIPQLPKRGAGKPVTMELVNKLRDEIPE
ncbi:CopG family transcriptional regulator [Massilia sp. SR12]